MFLNEEKIQNKTMRTTGNLLFAAPRTWRFCVSSLKEAWDLLEEAPYIYILDQS